MRNTDMLTVSYKIQTRSAATRSRLIRATLVGFTALALGTLPNPARHYVYVHTHTAVHVKRIPAPPAQAVAPMHAAPGDWWH